MQAVSVRSVRLPMLTDSKPWAASKSNSKRSQPPSGPIASRTRSVVGPGMTSRKREEGQGARSQNSFRSRPTVFFSSSAVGAPSGVK